MIWFIVFFIIIALSMAASTRFVPVEHFRRYARCPKDPAYWLAACLFNAIWTVAAIQLVVAPTAPPLFLRVVGAVGMIGGHALVIWARRYNPWALPIIAIPERLVATGPYALCRHPMYIGLLAQTLGGSFLLASTWSLVPCFLYWVLIARRTYQESRLLSYVFLSDGRIHDFADDAVPHIQDR